MHGSPPVEGRGEQVSTEKAAFDHPGTRAAWTRARRAVTARLAVATFLWLAAMIALIALHESGVTWPADPGEGDGVIGLVVALLPFAYLVVLYLYVSALRSTKRIRRILRAHPWQPIPAARKQSLLVDASGVAVQLQLSAAGEPERTSGPRSARGTVHRRRWPEAMERGAWYAGDVEGRGVLALPGGTDLMEVGPRP
ncbi:hypothetical protein [Streptomyces sp. CRN 30]|uniref:hypothetical protein n=1 Tax=Streptomyces sp. CRN 30 TaxID=3075613 RepID=UPI002A7F743D|nr:hypothetical protein [Streptomyces sp. CRN 30]